MQWLQQNSPLWILRNSDNRHPSSFYKICCVSSYWFILDDRNQGAIYIRFWRKFIEWCTGRLWFDEFFFITYMDPYLSNYLSLLIKIDMNQCVAYMHTTRKMISKLMQQTLVVKYPYQKILQQILLFIFVSILTS